MGRRQKEWAQRSRQELLEALGGVCVDCGSTVDLTFDCIDNRCGEHHRWPADKRLAFYRRQHQVDNLQILCRECNSAKGYLEGRHAARIRDAIERGELNPHGQPF